MGLITIPPIENGNEADDTLFNSRFALIANVLNGNIDGDNLAANAVSTVKLADGAITPVKWTNPYKFSAFIAATGAFANQTWTDVAALTENFDTNNNLNPTTGVYTVPVSGFYQISASAGTTSASGNLFGGAIRILKNTTTAVLGGNLRLDNNWSMDHDEFAVSGLVQLAAGDTIKMQGYLGLFGGSVGLANATWSAFLVTIT